MRCALCDNNDSAPNGAPVRVPGYAIDVCRACWEGAEAGWPRTRETRLMAALAAAGLLIPDRNEEGLLPRRYAPPTDFNL